MLQDGITKTNLLDIFYDHVSEEDWLHGVDIYQSGKVARTALFNGLITAKISEGPRPVEVRIKLHPSGHQIQWMECTCHKYRTKGFYCEHMSALLLHIDREEPDLVGSLDTKMPLKPPAGARKIREAKANIEDAANRTGNSRSHDLLIEHLDDSIHSVSLLSKGPKLRVRLEIKEGQLTHYDLPTDAAAKFLSRKTAVAKLSPDTKPLIVSEETAEIGFRIVLEDDEKIVAHRVIVLPSTKENKSKKKKTEENRGEILQAYSVRSSDGNKSSGKFEFFEFKKLDSYLGQEYVFIPGRGYWPYRRDSVPASWFEQPLRQEFKEDDAAELVAEGFKPLLLNGNIWIDPALFENKVDSRVLSQIKVHRSEQGWFVLDPKYGEGKGGVSMSALIKAYRKKRRKFHRTEEGWIRIPELVKQFQWQVDDDSNLLKVDTLGLLRLRAALGELDRFAGSKKSLDQIRDRTEFSELTETPSLANSKLNLRPYQDLGMKWLWWLYENRLHGLLADEMGLGKTHQSMALFTCVKAKKKNAKFLIVCPTTVIDHWYDKLKDFCPDLNVLKHYGPKRFFPKDRLGTDVDVLLSSYGILLRDIHQIEGVHWDVVVLDEAHYVKNQDTATYQAACRVQSDMRLCLSGTPLENHLSELKNIFDFLVPGYLGSDDYFKKFFASPINEESDVEREFALQKLLHPLKLRRTKVQVLDDLPEKVEDFRHCMLSDQQVNIYREVINQKANPIIQKLESGDEPIPYLHVFALLTLLKQICDHPALVQPGSDYRKHESGKFELVKELIHEAIGSGHKIVIYSQYLNMIEILKSYLTEEKIKHVSLTGQTRNRAEVIKQFQEDEDTKIFIGSLLAGGIGIDLTAASVVIHYDRWWNASKENQATDRVHRIGQTKNVQVLKLITRGTLEEKIDSMIRAKQAMFEKFLDKDEELFKSLSRQEIIELLK